MSHTKSDLQVVFKVQAYGVNVINMFCQVDAPLAVTLYILTNIGRGQNCLTLIKTISLVSPLHWHMMLML
jgi:hypothetical protein